MTHAEPMTDKELLKLAAKAAGIRGEFHSNAREGWWGIVLWDCLGDHPVQVWNPLTDDGDAFRLMVKLRLRPTIAWDGPGYVEMDWLNEYPSGTWSTGHLEEDGPDLNATTRRGITRAAVAQYVQITGGAG